MPINLDYIVLPALLGLLALLVVAVGLRRLRTLRHTQHSRLRTVGERLALSLASLLITVVAASSLVNAIALHLFWRAHPPAGQIIVVGQHTMHINCLGSGSPTLVLETGLGDDSLVWAGLQERLAQTTKVCAYDRAGFGWSDSRPGPRDADHIAAELHDLLHRAGISGPIVLMGHSIGGLYIRDYATLYPAQVAALIFVDSSSPLQNKNPAFVAGGGSGPPAWLLHTAMVAGVPRLIGMCSGGQHDAAYARNKERAEHVCGLHYPSIAAESSNFDRSGEEALRSSTFGTLPILVISHDPAKLLQAHHTAEDQVRQNAWSSMQASLKSLSSNNRQIIAVGSTHSVMEDRPDLLEKEVPLFLQTIRGAAPSPLSNGSTTRE